MNTFRLLVLAIVVCMSACKGGDSAHSESHTLSPLIRMTSTNNLVYDDLYWLVGSWKCVQSPTNETGLIGNLSDGGGKLILNVYKPYFYEIDLALTPLNSRQISAEFTVLEDNGKRHWLKDSWPIMIGTEQICVGWPNGPNFKYEYQKRDGNESLLLSIERNTFIFLKVSSVTTSPLRPNLSLPDLTSEEMRRQENLYREERESLARNGFLRIRKGVRP